MLLIVDDDDIEHKENVVHFVHRGSPKPLARHRSVVGGRSRKISTYNPSKAQQQDFLGAILRTLPQEPWTCSISMELHFYFERPESHFQKKNGQVTQLLKESAPLFPTKPDLDNLVKFVTDALNKRAYVDDSQIVEIRASKHFTTAAAVSKTSSSSSFLPRTDESSTGGSRTEVTITKYIVVNAP